jgi:hypothetical protein
MLSSIPDVWHFEHHAVWWINLTLGTKGLSSENKENFDDKHEKFITDIKIIWLLHCKLHAYLISCNSLQ